MDTIPSSLISMIFDNLSLRDCLYTSYVSHSWNKSVRSYLRERYSLSRYLSCFPHPKDLLEVFRKTKTVLAGSRAMSFFLPSQRIYTANSDWDVFAPYPHQQIMHDQLLAQGFFNIERIKQSHHPDRFKVYDFINANGDKVQLIALTQEWNLFECIMNFHKSTVQNFIAGSGAF